MTWQPVVWERTTIDADEIERQRMKALWARLPAAQPDEDEIDDDESEDDDE